MATHAHPGVDDGYTSSGTAYDAESLGSGWVGFAAIMLGFAGFFNVIDGIVALSRSSFYTANAHYVVSNLHTWGWVILGLGVVQVLAAFALGTGSEWARWFGIAMASLNAIGQLMFIQAYPFWSMCAFAVDVLIIYALSVHAGHKLRV